MTSQKVRNIANQLMAKADVGKVVYPWECELFASNLLDYAKDIEVLEDKPIPIARRAPLDRKFGVIRGGSDAS